jgi:hypothetical protein
MRRTMTRALEPTGSRARFLLLATCLAAALPLAAASGAPDAITVRVTYTGVGPVDSRHDLQVFIFDDPEIGRSSVALDFSRLPENRGTVEFRHVTTDPVFVAVAYNASGDYDGATGPPPAGTPIAIYRIGKRSAAAPVHPGDSIAIEFDGSTQMGP